jgi:hypothetical protein
MRPPRHQGPRCSIRAGPGSAAALCAPASTRLGRNIERRGAAGSRGRFALTGLGQGRAWCGRICEGARRRGTRAARATGGTEGLTSTRRQPRGGHARGPRHRADKRAEAGGGLFRVRGGARQGIAEAGASTRRRWSTPAEGQFAISRLEPGTTCVRGMAMRHAPFGTESGWRAGGRSDERPQGGVWFRLTRGGYGLRTVDPTVGQRSITARGSGRHSPPPSARRGAARQARCHDEG